MKLCRSSSISNDFIRLTLSSWPCISYRGVFVERVSQSFTRVSYEDDMNCVACAGLQQTAVTQPLWDVKFAFTTEPKEKQNSFVP